MSENKEHIISSSGCFSSETLKKYVLGELSSLENHQIEKHLLDCEICSDEVDGLELLYPNKETEQTILLLNTKIQERVAELKSKKNRFSLWFYRIAAAILILFVFTVVLYFNNHNNKLNKEYAINVIPEEDQPANVREKTKEVSGEKIEKVMKEGERQISEEDSQKQPKGGEVYETDEEIDGNSEDIVLNDVIAQNKTDELDAAEEADFDLSNQDNAQTKQKNVFGDGFIDSELSDNLISKEKKDMQLKQNVDSAFRLSDKSLEAEKTTVDETWVSSIVAKDSDDRDDMNKKAAVNTATTGKGEYEKAPSGVYSETVTTSDNARLAEAENLEEVNEVMGGVEPKKESDFDRGIVKYRKADFSGAVRYFNRVSETNDSLYNALYYKGVSYYNLKKYVSAIKCFDTIIIVKYKPFMDDALWYKAQSLIQTDKPDMAKILLKELVERESKYAIKAQEAIIELN